VLLRQGVFVVKIALSSFSWPQPPDSPKKIAGRKSAGKNAASRKSAEKVRQPAKYKKKNRLGSKTDTIAVADISLYNSESHCSLVVCTAGYGRTHVRCTEYGDLFRAEKHVAKDT